MTIIKSFSVGNGDMFYIKHVSSNFTTIDCCLNDDNKENIVNQLKEESKYKQITRFISTHPDEDHLKGLSYLDDEIPIINFYCVGNETTKEDETVDFKRYCSLRDSDKAFYIYKNCKRKWMNVGDDTRGSAGISILWPDTGNEHYKTALTDSKEGKSPNNISPIIEYSLEDGVNALWMGDLETEFMENIEDDIDMPDIDILFAPHHGRNSGKVPESWLKEMTPQIIIIGEADSTHLNYYKGYNTITQNSAGDIIFECESGKVHIYVSSDTYSVDFLNDEKKSAYDNYIGSLDV